MLNRRHTDLPVLHDRRRSGTDRRRAIHRQTVGIRLPSRQEQAVQFLTRYLFAILGLIFFNAATDFQTKWMPITQINILFGIYLVVNTGNFVHAWLKPFEPSRYRFALWIDLALVTVCLVNDPYDIPPSLAAYIVVVLGNGMRYGMRFFGEALGGALLGGSLGVGLRYLHLAHTPSPGTIFLSLFGAITVVYAYILMSRVENARHRSEQVSRTDPLTGLVNRRGLNEVIESWLANTKREECKRVVMFADLDNFKSVNDTRGHAEGDRTLAQVALLLLQSVRSSDLVVRYGGDEFVLLLADADLREAELVAGRIQNSVKDWFHANRLACGISIGYTEVPPGGWNLEQVLQSVDEQLYQSKAERLDNRLQPIELI